MEFTTIILLSHFAIHLTDFSGVESKSRAVSAKPSISRTHQRRSISKASKPAAKTTNVASSEPSKTSASASNPQGATTHEVHHHYNERSSGGGMMNSLIGTAGGVVAGNMIYNALHEKDESAENEMETVTVEPPR